MSSNLVPFALVLFASAARAGHVQVVDASGGGAYTQIQPAINATDDGDVVLVKSGSYAGFTIGNKAIAVVADVNAVVTVSGAAVVRNVGAGKSVVLSGLSITGDSNTTSAHGDGLYVENCAAAVRVERCTLNGAFVPSLPYPTKARPGAELLTSPNVAFVGCTLRGVTSLGTDSADGGDGLTLASSSASLYDCACIGGTGQTGGLCPGPTLNGGNAGSGLRATSSFVFASHTSFSGGNGGNASFHGCGAGFPDGGAGGNGVSLATSSEAKIVVCTYAHGTGGAPGVGYGLCSSCPGDPGEDGVNIVADPSSHLVTLPSAARQMIAPGAARENARLPLQFHVVPGDQVMLFVWSEPSFVYSPTLLGMRLVIPPKPMLVWVSGTADANGDFADSITFPDLGPGVDCGLVFLQCLCRDVVGNLYLGSNASVAVLDSSF